jgi:CTP synthase (UTP-ammonia lyase)
MQNSFTLALVGDYDASVPAHLGIPRSLDLAAESLSVAIDYEWVGTEAIQNADRLAGYDGIWCVPATPYRNMAGALLAIHWARTQARPFLGTCGGFQHAIIEYARAVLGLTDADHAESNPTAQTPLISPLSCALINTTDDVNIVPGSRLAAAYGRPRIAEGYLCRYGLNPQFQAALCAGPLWATATDAGGEVRAIELIDHPFYVATLFQPERAALRGELSPLILAFATAIARR